MGRKNVVACIVLALLATMLVAPLAVAKPIPPGSPSTEAFGSGPSLGGGEPATGGDPEEPFERLAPATQECGTGVDAAEEAMVPVWVRSLLELLVWLGVRH